MSFIHCYDELLKDTLLSKGCKLVQDYKTTNLNVWVFEHNKEIMEYLVFSQEKKYFMSNKLNF